MWLMLYNCPNGSRRGSLRAVGLWSAPTKLLGKDEDVGCRLVMIAEGCGNRRDFWRDKQRNGKVVAGGFYAPFVRSVHHPRRCRSGASRSSTIIGCLDLIPTR